MINSNKNLPLEDKFISSVKVGSKGQIVIPKEVRKMFDIKSGNTLLLLADINRGIAMHHYDILKKVMDDAFKIDNKKIKEKK
ncbi:MAG TPA: AbrB/MazE/SpoVT family DNA-binding domain-containing protein [Patescibacteria group bacterium]